MLPLQPTEIVYGAQLCVFADLNYVIIIKWNSCWVISVGSSFDVNVKCVLQSNCEKFCFADVSSVLLIVWEHRLRRPRMAAEAMSN